MWQPGARRHEYDHHLGYDLAHQADVEAVCSRCHHQRERRRDGTSRDAPAVPVAAAPMPPVVEQSDADLLAILRDAQDDRFLLQVLADCTDDVAALLAALADDEPAARLLATLSEPPPAA